VAHVKRLLLHVESPLGTHIIYAISHADGGRSSVTNNPSKGRKRPKGIRVAEWPVEQKIDAALCGRRFCSKGPEYFSREAAIMVSLTEKPTLAEALSSLVAGARLSVCRHYRAKRCLSHVA